MATPERPENGSIYQIKVTLEGSDPPIWRTVQLPGDTTLEELHYVIQIVMDWENYHMRQFIADDRSYGLDEDFMPDPESERIATLKGVAPKPKDRLLYEYDFGDSWEHDVLVENILPSERGV
ncbi:MAG: plasmid pRiA4b ORF-3 family protein, partial [Rubrobacteraceae bacterium]|nr:plasmid pRiA4b ORF-3 family protein [Rubrobacteraceae bacterium]